MLAHDPIKVFVQIVALEGRGNSLEYFHLETRREPKAELSYLDVEKTNATCRLH